MPDDPHDVPAAPLLSELIGRARTLFGLKVFLFIVAMPLFTAGYVAAQYVSPFDPVMVPATWVDRAVPFAAWWVWPYVTLYVFIPAGPLLWTRREEIRDYVIALTITEVVCLLMFVLVPTGVPRAFLEDGSPLNWAMRLIVTIDRPVNACPSLHAGLVALTLIAVTITLRSASARLRVGVHTIGWVWGAVILLGTLGTKQHQAWDLAAGIAVAAGAYAAALCIGRRPRKNG